jgi:ribosomal RNA assembly protein
MFEEEILIPKARVAVLIGKKGASKRAIEKKGHIKLKISREGMVKIIADDAMELWVARDVVEAVGRGFNPDVAKEIFHDDMGYQLIKLEDYVKPSGMERVKGVIIGTGGKMKRTIEQSVNGYVSVYGKTVAIIAPEEKIVKAHKAIEMLLTGAKHSTVYRFLERNNG